MSEGLFNVSDVSLSRKHSSILCVSSRPTLYLSTSQPLVWNTYSSSQHPCKIGVVSTWHLRKLRFREVICPRSQGWLIRRVRIDPYDSKAVSSFYERESTNVIHSFIKCLLIICYLLGTVLEALCIIQRNVCGTLYFSWRNNHTNIANLRARTLPLPLPHH